MSEEVKATIKHLRDEMRYHRDQKGDDRCWLDDERLWRCLPDATEPRRTLPAYEEMMTRCQAFHAYRRSETADPVPSDAMAGPGRWDEDLQTMSADELQGELNRLQDAVRRHRDIVNHPRTLDDDRLLYAILPEHLPADFRLPSEEDFLGEGRAPYAGCPSFWRSHQECEISDHDLSQWGPCRA